MRERGPHEPEKLTRYVFGDLPRKERDALEHHLRTCQPCQEYVSFVRDFNAGLREAKPQEQLPGEPCPDRSLLIALEEDELDSETAEHVRVHMLFCKDCRNDYETLEQLRPKTIEVVLRAVGALMEVLRPPEVGAWQSLAATITVRGESVPSAPFRAGDTLIDRDRNRSKVALRVEQSLKANHVGVFVESDVVLPEWKWRLCLLDRQDEEWASMPLDRPEVRVSSALPYGYYTLEVLKGEDCLGSFKFTVENYSPDEALERAHEYLQSGDYLRAIAILRDALLRDPENERLLQELNRAEELAAEEETGEGEEEDEGEQLEDKEKDTE